VPRAASAEEEEELLQDHLHAMQGVEPAPQPDAVLTHWRRRFGARGGPDGSGAGRLKLYRPVGCTQCHQSGYSGRAGIHELLTVTRGLRQLIQNRASAEELQRQAQAEGLLTLRQDGIEKALAGVTTIEEVRANS
jgi:type II secretory ATPase GspE/PulE/Tfp pilus assembly ATPase PilB-like protein